MKNLFFTFLSLILLLNAVNAVDVDYWADGRIRSIGNKSVDYLYDGRIRSIGE